MAKNRGTAQFNICLDTISASPTISSFCEVAANVWIAMTIKTATPRRKSNQLSLSLSSPHHLLDHLFPLFSYHALHRLFQYAFGRYVQVVHDPYGIALVPAVGEYLEQHGTIGETRSEETVELPQIILLILGRKVFISQILRIVAHQLARLIAIVTGRGDVIVRRLAEGGAGMHVVAKLRPFAVID